MTIRPLKKTAWLALAPAVVVALAAAPAAAASHRTPAQRHLVTAVGRSGSYTTNSNTVGTSTSNAGYLWFPPDDTKVTFNSMVVVPSVSCDASVTAPFFINFFLNGSLADSTFAGSGLAVTVQCNGTTPTYSLGYLDDEQGSARSLPISAGDRIQFSGAVTPTSEQYRIVDVTRNKSFSFTGAGLTVQNAQITTQFGFGTTGGFAPFGSMAYYDVTFGGQPLDQPSTYGFSQVDNAGDTLVQTSSLTTNGKAFGLTYVSNVGDPAS